MKSAAKKFMRANQTGEDDWADRKRVEKHLESKGYITRNNWYIAFDDYGKLGIYENITKKTLEKYNRIRHPDIIVGLGPYKFAVVEIDGSAHRGGKKDMKRAVDYEGLGMKLIIINKADLAETGESWESYLDRRLAA